jgi:hypothetical protein
MQNMKRLQLKKAKKMLYKCQEQQRILKKRSKLYTWQTFTHGKVSFKILDIFQRLSLFEMWQNNINPKNHKVIICYSIISPNLESFGFYFPRYKVPKFYKLFGNFRNEILTFFTLGENMKRNNL